MVDDGRLARTVGRAIDGLGVPGIVLVVVVLLGGVAGTLYGVAHVIAWAVERPQGVPVRALIVGGASACVTWLCFRAIRGLGEADEG